MLYADIKEIYSDFFDYDYTFIENNNIPCYCNEAYTTLNGDKFKKDVIRYEYVKSTSGITDCLAFIDKLMPHSILDTMIMCMDNNKSSINDLNFNSVWFIFRTIYGFIQFVSKNEVITKYQLDKVFFQGCFNYSNTSRDRETGMSEKRFHLHLNFWRENEICFSNKKLFRQLKNKSDILYYIDPLEVVGEYIFYDYFTKVEFLSGKVISPYECKEIYSTGFKIEYDGWMNLMEKNFILDILLVDRTISDIYHLFESVFLEGDVKGEWKRKKLRDINDIQKNINCINWLSLKTKKMLYIIASNLKDIDDKLMGKIRNNKYARTRLLAIDGVNYSLSIIPANYKSKKIVQSKKFMVIIQPKMFCDKGGAGIPCIGNVAKVNLVRNARRFTYDEMCQRKEFHKDFIEYIDNLNI